MVLDIGCAEGEQLESYVEGSPDHSGFGIDIMDLKQLVDARDDLEYVRGDAVELPFQDSSFDLVTAAEVIEHIPNHDEFLSEIHRVLKDDGAVVLSTPNEAQLSSRIGDKLERLRKNDGKHHLSREKYSHVDGVEGEQHGHVSEVTPEILARELESNGFEVEEMVLGGLNPYIPPFNWCSTAYRIANSIVSRRPLDRWFKWDTIVLARAQKTHQ